MFNQCYTGDFTLVTETIGKECVRHQIIQKSQGLSATGDMESDDEDDDQEQLNENNSAMMHASNAALNSGIGMGGFGGMSGLGGTVFNMNTGNNNTDTSMEQEQVPVYVKPAPIIDDDGFETVVKHRKPKK